MELWLLLVVLGGITYFMIQRSVASLTRTPTWLLWLVVMAPALSWGVWMLLVGDDEPLPILLILVPLLVCPLLYLWLVQRGQRDLRSPATNSEISEPPNSSTPQPPPTGQDASSSRLLSKEEEARLRNCFPWEFYYLQHVDYSAQAVLCRGKLRAVPERAYRHIRQKIEQQFGDRFLVLFQEGLKGDPFFALVPNPRHAKNPAPSAPITRPGLALGLLGLTLLTTTAIGAEFAGVTFDQLQAEPALLLQGLPYALGLIWILGIHELSHYLTAVYYKIRTTLPYFIPIPFFLGTFGAYIQMRSPVPNRKALFDISFAGPFGGFLVTVPVLLWGLSLSQVVPLSEDSGLLNIESLNPRLSLLMMVFSKLALGDQLAAGDALHLHPIAIAGYIGLVVTALNLMPVGQLDGGHIVHAMFGQRTAAIIGQISRLLTLVLATVEPSFLIWAILLFFMPILDEPALNDVSELDNWRDLLGLLSLGLLVCILLPAPPTLIQWLNL